LIADGHNDLLLELSYKMHRLGQEDVFAQTWLPLLEQGDVWLQVCPIFIELEHQPEGTLRRALSQAAAFHAAARDNPGQVLVVRTQDDLAAVERGELMGLVLALEGVEPFGYETWPVELFWELGLRMASLTWNRRNPYADGAAETGGISALGRRLVARMAELDIALDLSHASEPMFWELVDDYDGPVLVSHAGCRAVNDHPRNLTDEQLQAVAARGGVLGIMLHPLAIDPQNRTIERVLDHLDHALEVMGPQGVALGGDFIARLKREVPMNPLPDGLMPAGLEEGSSIEGLAGPEDYPALVEAMEARGYAEDVIDGVLHRNLVRVLRETLPAA
jgi:membrane dipeptidase